MPNRARCRTALEARTLNRAGGLSVLRGDLTQHLGYAHGEDKPAGQGNQRNGSTRKTVLTEDATVDVAIPRDCEGSFEPQLIPKHARRPAVA